MRDGQEGAPSSVRGRGGGLTKGLWCGSSAQRAGRLHSLRMDPGVVGLCPRPTAIWGSAGPGLEAAGPPTPRRSPSLGCSPSSPSRRHRPAPAAGRRSRGGGSGAWGAAMAAAAGARATINCTEQPSVRLRVPRATRDCAERAGRCRGEAAPQGR